MSAVRRRYAAGPEPLPFMPVELHIPSLFLPYCSALLEKGCECRYWYCAKKVNVKYMKNPHYENLNTSTLSTALNVHLPFPNSSHEIKKQEVYERAKTARNLVSTRRRSLLPLSPQVQEDLLHAGEVGPARDGGSEGFGFWIRSWQSNTIVVSKMRLLRIQTGLTRVLEVDQLGDAFPTGTLGDAFLQVVEECLLIFPAHRNTVSATVSK